MVENHENELNIDESEEAIHGDEMELEQEEISSSNKMKELRDKLRTCEEEKMKNMEELQRIRADFLNSKRRLEEQLLRDKERAADKFLIELLTLADSFDTATADKNRWNSVDAQWRNGIEAIEAKLHSILKNSGITSIDPLGEMFDPAEHEAVSNIAVDSEEQIDKIITVLQKGYRRNTDILRPARVVVGTKQ